MLAKMRGPMRVSGLAMGMGLGMVMALVAIMFICLIAPVQVSHINNNPFISYIMRRPEPRC